MTFPLIECNLHRIQQSGNILLSQFPTTRSHQIPVNHYEQPAPCKPLHILQHRINPNHPPLKGEKSGVTGILHRQKFLYLILILQPLNLRKNICSNIVGSIIFHIPYEFHHIICRMALHLLPCNRRISAPYLGKKESQIIINLGSCTHSRTWVTGIYLLLNGNGRGNPLNLVNSRLLHTPQELACKRRKALGKTPLPLRKKSIKRQRRFSAAAQATHHYQFSAGYLKVNPLKVVCPCPLYVYIFLVPHKNHNSPIAQSY